MKTGKITLAIKSLLVLVLLLSVLLVAFVGCEEKGVNPNHVLPEDGTYKIVGMQEQIPMHPENFADELIIEKKGDIYYVTVGILNNESVERLYWKGRKDSKDTDSVQVTEGKKTDYMFAFTNEQVQKTLDFKIGGKMPFDPPLAFSIDWTKVEKVSDKVADVTRPELFLD